MNIQDCSGHKPYKVHSVSATFTLIDGFSSADVAFKYACSMLGSYNNCGTSGTCEQYTQATVYHAGLSISEVKVGA